MCRVAFDTQLSKAAVRAVEDAGHEVVYWAGSEHDELWFREALDAGAEVFVSPDWDISILANHHNVRCIRLPQRVGGEALVRFILKQLGANVSTKRVI